MIPLIFILLGAVYGAYRAKRLGGKTADKIQFGAGFALAGFAIATITGMLLDHLI